MRKKGATNKMLTLDMANRELTRVKEEKDLLEGRCTVGHLLDNIFLSYSKENKRSYLRDVTSVRNLKKGLPVDMPITQVGVGLLEDYKNKRKREITNSSVNRELAALRKAFNLAIKRRLAMRNPVSDLKFLPENKRRSRYLSQDEIEKLLEESPDHLRPIVIFALNTGMRAGEIFGLTWERVDRNTEPWTVEISQTKNGETRYVPLIPDAVDAMGKPKAGGYVFTFNSKPLKRVQRSFKTACKNAGIEDFRFHDLRHTWASYYMMRGGNLYDLMVTGGWKSISMVQRYAHLSTDYRKRMMEIASPTSGLNLNVGQKPVQKPFIESQEIASA